MSTQQDITFYYLEKHIQSLRNAALNAARMAWNPHEYYFGESSPVEAELDPGPLMHYGAIYTCVQSVVQYIPQTEKKAFLRPYDDLAQSRENYLVIHYKYQNAYVMLQDARAFHTIMLEKKAKVERRIAELEGMEGLEKKRTEMQAIMMQIAKNRQEVPELLARTRDLAHRRDEVCSTFMAMKKEVEVHKIPVLRRFHEQIRRKQQERQKVLALQSSSGLPPAPVPAEQSN